MCRGQWIFYVLYVDLAKPKSGASDHNKVLQGISWREVNNVPGVNSHQNVAFVCIKVGQY